MPELPEVETVRRGLAPALQGRRIARVRVNRRDLRRPLPKRFETRLKGRIVESLERRAKYLLGRLDDGAVLVIHLGMSGRVKVFEGGARPPPEKHDHVIVETEAGTGFVYNDARRFGLMDLISDGNVNGHPLFADLGPEPLGSGFDGRALLARVSGKRTPLKAALLDQRVVAGLGNIYVCEALFRSKLSPDREAGALKPAEAKRLADAVKAVLDEAIAAGGSSLRDHRRPDGELGYFQHRFTVYGREGEACPICKTPIERAIHSGRSTFHCPVCQG